MKRKILSFIYNGEKFLALHGQPHPEHGEGSWFVVTGAIEGNETSEDALWKRWEETFSKVLNKYF